MGAVHKAIHPKTGQVIAVKVLHPQFANNPRVAKAFLNEAWSQYNLPHPNIVRVHGFLEQPVPAILMEYVEGPTLETVIRQEMNGAPMSPHEVFAIIGPLLRGLAYCHGRKVVHRDIKPGNILLNRAKGARPGRPKLTDFGLVRILDEGSDARRVRMGTPPYMAPEQYRFVQDVGPEADVFSVGMLMWRLLTGYLPVDPRDESSLEALYSGNSRPRDLKDMGLGVNNQVSDAVKAALRADPRRRPRDAGAFLEALGISGANSSSYEEGGTLNTPFPENDIEGVPPHTSGEMKSPFQQSWFWVVIGLVALWAIF
jgi:serine/threonine-protein kinase